MHPYPASPIAHLFQHVNGLTKVISRSQATETYGIQRSTPDTPIAAEQARSGGHVTGKRRRYVKVALGQGGLVDLADRLVERLVELVLTLLRGETVEQCPGEAGDETGIAGELCVRLLAAVAPGERDDS